MAEKKNIKVKTFATELREFKAMRELADLDEQVNKFIKEKRIKKVVSVSDTTTTDITGASIRLIRVLAYET
jgi:endonuclease YncB( thermonuclease family)